MQSKIQMISAGKVSRLTCRLNDTQTWPKSIIRKAASFLAIMVALLVSSEIVAQTTVTLGVGTGTSSTNSLFSTSTTGNFYSRSASIYTATEIIAAGGMAGNITKIRWHKDAGSYTSNNINLTVYMKQVMNSTHPAANDWTSEVAGATQVFTTTTQGFPAGDGWVEITLATPFLWDGSSNLEVLTDFYRPNAVNSAIGWYRSTVTNTNLARVGSTLAGVEPLLLNSNRPDIQLVFIPATPCTGIPTPGTAGTSAVNVCSGTDFTLTLTGSTLASGIDVQWQSSSDNTTYNDITGLTGTAVTTSQTTSTWYRAKVTCNSGTPAFSTPVQVNTPMLVSGTFSINSGLATGGTNFQTFADAISFISCGIGGPVTFNVFPGSGPYTGQIVIPQINGASATNRVTFNGNGETVTFEATVSGSRHTILLDNADYITISGFNIVSSGATYGWGIHLFGDTDFNEITDNNFSIASASTTAANSASIVASGSATSITTGGTADNNLIATNTTSGGYNGFVLVGDASTSGTNNTILANTIQDYYGYGIDLDDQVSAVVSGNDISRPTRTTTGAHYGINLSGATSQNNLIQENLIHDTHTAIPTTNSLSYGIFITGADAPASAPNRVINNLIYNINLAAGSAIINGLGNTSSDNAHYFHNTVSLDYTASANNDIVRGFYQTTSATGIQFRNNIISITQGGTGNKTAIYLNTAASSVATSNNVLYVNGASGTNQIGSIGTTGYATLAAWQGLGHDAGTVNANPQFSNIGTGNFIPTNTAVMNTGTPVGVLTDINGLARNATTPDAGAHEVATACTTPVIVVTPNQGICPGASATLTASGAITYTWSDGQTGDNISVSPTTTTVYTVTGYVNTCSASVATTVTILPEPAATVTVTDALCNGTATGTATATVTSGTAPYTYGWSPAGGFAATATGLMAGTYTVTVTDDNGCFTTAAGTIAEPTPISVSATATGAACTGAASGSATVTATGGTGVYSYSWNTSPVQTTATATGLMAGNYTVTVTDANNCTATETVTITEPAAAVTGTITATDALCFGAANGTATVTANGGTGAYTYTWNTTPAQTSATATGLAAGTYQVTITDANACTATETITITEPASLVAATSVTDVSCNGLTNGLAMVAVTGGTGPYTYSWDTTPSLTTASISGLAAGTYNVIVTDSNGCTATAPATVSAPSALVVSTSSTNITCNGGLNGMGTVSATGGTAPYNYSWATFPVQTSATAVGMGAGTYSVTVTDANGCSGAGAITITQPTAITATISASSVACIGVAGGSASVTANGGTGTFTYLWSTTPEQTTATATDLTPGIYTVVVTDQAGCQKLTSVTITGMNQPVANFSSANSGTTYTFNNTSANATNYTWNFGDGTPNDTASNPIHAFAGSGTYTVTLIAANQCGTDTISKVVNIVLGVEEAATAAIVLAPNPASNYFNINLTDAAPEQTTLRIYSIDGRLVKEESLTVTSPMYSREVSTATFSKGVYMVQVMLGNKLYVQRLVIQ